MGPTAEANDNKLSLALPDPKSLPMFVDNVIPTMLVHLGIIDLSECHVKALKEWGKEVVIAKAERSQQQKAQGEAEGEGESTKRKTEVVKGPELTKDEAYIIRAAALDAGEKIKRRAIHLASSSLSSSSGEADKLDLAWLNQMNEVDIDGYLWSVAKDDKELRKVPRLVERSTVMY